MTLVLSACIFALAFGARTLFSLSVKLLGRGTVGAVSVAAALICLATVARKLPDYSLRRCAGVMLIGAAFLVACTLLPVPEERIHILLFGALAFSAAHDNPQFRNGPRLIVACLYGSGIGLLDELLQVAIPGRVGDPRDVLIDLCGAVLGVLSYGCVVSTPAQSTGLTSHSQS